MRSVTELDVDQIVDLIKRSDRADAVALLKNALAVAHSAGATQGTAEAYERADQVLAKFMPIRVRGPAS